jgi:hypothetical protein
MISSRKQACVRPPSNRPSMRRPFVSDHRCVVPSSASPSWHPRRTRSGGGGTDGKREAATAALGHGDLAARSNATQERDEGDNSEDVVAPYAVIVGGRAPAPEGMVPLFVQGT